MEFSPSCTRRPTGPARQRATGPARRGRSTRRYASPSSHP